MGASCPAPPRHWLHWPLGNWPLATLATGHTGHWPHWPLAPLATGHTGHWQNWPLATQSQRDLLACDPLEAGGM